MGDEIVTQDSLVAGSIWVLTTLLGLGTFGFRLSFIQLQSWLDEFPPRLRSALAFIPASVLAALVFPELVVLDGSIGGLFTVRLFAGILAAIVAWRTESMIATISVGMIVLWTAQLIG